MKVLQIKKVLNIILTFWFKLVPFVLCTIFLPLIWVFDETLSFKGYFKEWGLIFLSRYDEIEYY